jgi:hypothetical protein
MTKLLTKEDFAPHVGKAFHFDGFDTPLTLDRIIDYPIQPHQTRQPFLLIFRGPRRPVMETEIRDCKTETGEAFWLHVGPILTPPGDFQEYQSSFN